MSRAKHERWTEAEVNGLPEGEHDYFERKGGDLFENQQHLLGVLAKALSAFANSGGGHLILGVRNDGTPDGVPRNVGNTSVREWLEQKIPRLLDYPLSDFRVHVVDRPSESRIPPDRDVIVIDVGDSALAPHQCATGAGAAKERVYYHRQAGHSVPAPHFYLELLRHRLIGPTLDARATRLQWELVSDHEDWWVNFTLPFQVENRGRVAAYHWQLNHTLNYRAQDLRELSAEDLSDVHKGPFSFSATARDRTLLPGCTVEETVEWAQRLDLRLARLSENQAVAVLPQLALVARAALCYRLATETSPGEDARVRLGDLFDPQGAAADIGHALEGEGLG